ncbi:MAG: hypothetical protein AAGA77_24190, partial [Bacteroidota bacterium]
PLPSANTSRYQPCSSANTSPCRAYKGLEPSSVCDMPGAPNKKACRALTFLGQDCNLGLEVSWKFILAAFYTSAKASAIRRWSNMMTKYITTIGLNIGL